MGFCLYNLICPCCSDLNVPPGPRVQEGLSVSTPGVTCQALGGGPLVLPQPVQLPFPRPRPGPREVAEEELSELTETLNFYFFSFITRALNSHFVRFVYFLTFSRSIRHATFNLISIYYLSFLMKGR